MTLITFCGTPLMRIRVVSQEEIWVMDIFILLIEKKILEKSQSNMLSCCSRVEHEQ